LRNLADGDRLAVHETSPAEVAELLALAASFPAPPDHRNIL